MFANQDSLGNRDWSWLSRSLEIQSSLSFERCASDTTTPPIVRAGLAIGSELNVAGTPTVFLNGWRFAGMPSDTEINRAVEDLLSGKTPYKKFPSNAINAR
jgi:protein-disulfide isomerase